MPVPNLVADPGAPDANSYATLDEAAAYVAALAGPAARAWEALDDDAKKRSLLTATIRLDQEGYAGRKASPTQALKWPRVGARDEDGRPYPVDVVPGVVKDAQIELAIGFDGTSDPSGPGELDAYSAVKVGPLTVNLRDAPKPGALPAQVRRLLAHVLTTGGGMIRLVRG